MLNNNPLERQFRKPEDEINYFKEKVEKKSQINYGESFQNLDEKKRSDLIKKSLEEHQQEAVEIIHPDLLEKSKNSEEIILRLSPDKDDEKMSELLGLMQEVGIFNTLKAIEQTESFHILDDFHRFLVQYIKEGYETGIKEKNDIYPGLHMTLFEIILPDLDEDREEAKGKKLDELLSATEQFYAGMFALAENGSKNYFSIEISYPQGSDLVSFFCAVPNDMTGVFKNHLLAVFKDVKIKEITDDYNIFNGLKFVSGSELFFTDSNFLPIKTYKELEYDPLNIILQSFNNFSINEGASIQIMLSPEKTAENNKIDKKIDKLNKGEKIKDVLYEKKSLLAETADFIYKEFFGNSKKNEEKKEIKDQEKRNILIEELKKKNSSRLYKTNIRFITSGENQYHSEVLLKELESSFLQFENINGNKFEFRKVPIKKMNDFVRKYTFRIFEKEKSILMNISELTSIFHFPKQQLSARNILTSSSVAAAQVSNKIASVSKKIKNSNDFGLKESFKIEPKKTKIIEKNNQNPFLNYKIDKEKFIKKEDAFIYGQDDQVEFEQEGLKANEFLSELKKETYEVGKEFKNQKNQSQLKTMGDASFGQNEKPIILGINEYQGEETPIYFKPLDRMRHMYVIGQTGTGKTTLLKNMIVQDIKNGDGVCFIDPHGSDIQDILAQIPPERHEDVIYFDPADLERPMGLNMLEYDARYPEQKSFVVNELLAIFNKLFDMKTAGGPMFEMYFRNAVLLTIDDPKDEATLLDVVRVLSDKEYRDMKLAKSTNLTVNQFWKKIAEQAGGEASMENVIPYITSKFDGFLSNDYMRPIISQGKSAFNFRDVMDNRKILLINLSKGRLGELNANLLGLIIVGKILMAALSRVDSLDQNLPPFYLYIDEFQNVTTDSISQILSEARKYKLSLNIAHQYIKQIDEGIKDAVFGNVGSMAIFRVGQEDAEFLEKQLAPTFSASDIASIDNRNAYLKMLVDGEPQKPFNIRTLAPEPGNKENARKVIELSRKKYGKNREEVQRIIREKIAKI